MLELSLRGDGMQTHPSIRWPLHMQFWYCRLRKREDTSPRVQRYTLSNELRNFKTARGTRVGASVR